MTAQPTPDHIARHRKDMWKIRLIGLGILAVGLILGAGLFGWELYAGTWPTVDGKVTNSSIVHNNDGNNYSMTIWYDYEVDDQSYSGRHSATSSGRPSAPRNGSSVDVHYNPTFPWLSRMEASIPAIGLIMSCCCILPFGLLFLAISFLPPQKPMDFDKMRKMGL